MTTQISQVSCRNCGANVELSSRACEYCGNPVSITTLRSAALLSKPLLLKYAKSYETTAISGEDKDCALGIIFLNLRQYQKARASFDISVSNTPDSSELYFYRAISTLAGRKPFLCVRSEINDIIQDLSSAIDIEDRPIYRYFLAIIKYDYFHRKSFRINPSFADELCYAKDLGLANGDVEILLKLLELELPDVFLN